MRTVLMRSRGARRRRSVCTLIAVAVALYAVTGLASRPVLAAPTPSAGTINLFAGGNSGGTGGSPLNAVVQPAAVAVDSARHILYIADSTHNRVLEVTPGTDGVIGRTSSSGQYIDTDDTITILAGTGVDGSSNATNPKALGDGGPASGALLSGPAALAVDAAGNLYISDFGDLRVRFVCQAAGGCTLPSGGKALPQGDITSLAGTGVNQQESGDGGPAISAGTYDPWGLALDSSGNLLVVDQNGGGDGTVRFICVQGNGGSSTQCTVPASTATLPKGDITTIAGAQAGQFADNSGDGGAATHAVLADPSWITVDSAGNYYVRTQGELAAGEMRAVNTGGVISKLTITSCPSVVDLDQMQATPDGTALYVSASGCGVILRQTLATGVDTPVAGNGSTGGTTGDGGLATAAEISSTSIALDSAGDLFLTDTNRVRQVVVGFDAVLGKTNSSGQNVDTDDYVNTVAGNGSTTFLGDGGPAANAAVTPVDSSMATDRAGNVYISDGSHRVRFICQKAATSSCSTPFGSVIGQNIATIAGDGTAGYAGDGGLATGAQMYNGGIALDPNGNLLIANPGSPTSASGVRFVCLQTTTSCATPFGQVGSGGITTIAGGGLGGFSGDGGPATNAEVEPTTLVTDGAGNLYIGDFNQNRVRFVCLQLSQCTTPFGSVASGNITTIAGNGTHANSGDGGPAVNAAVTPFDLALDPSGNLFVTGDGDVRSICVRMTLCHTNAGLAPPGSILAIAGSGQICAWSSTNTCGDGGPATSAEFDAVNDLALDTAGNLYVGDRFVVRFICMVASCPTYLSSRTALAQGAITTIAGTGTAGDTGDGHPANAASIEIQALAIDAANNVFIGDGADNVVREITAPATLQQYASPLNLGFPLTSVGSSSTQTVTLNNPTSSSVTVSSVAITGSNATDYRITSGGDHCSSTTVAAGGTCTVQVALQPGTATQLNRVATLTFTDSGGPTTTQTANLVGQAPPLPTVTGVSPASGPTSNATTVTITGTNLQYVTSASFGTAKTYAVTDDPTNPTTTLEVASPGSVSAAGGTVDVAVSGTGGTSAISSSDKYTLGAWGWLRVTTPPLNVLISLDGNYLDDWGLSWLHTDVGAHTLCYTDIEGWATPACQQVTVNQGVTTTVSAPFVQRGWLRTELSPNGVDGTISVDGTPMDDYADWTDIGTGSHQVCFSAAANFTPPPCQTVTVTAGQTTVVMATYTSSPGAPGQTGTGLLRVTTNPTLASQISVDGIPRDTWGLSWLQLPGGPATHTVCFRSVQTWQPPACSTVTITAGQTTTVTGTFTELGYVHVNNSPTTTDAPISIDGIARNEYGDFPELPVGAHTVCWGAAPSVAAPPCQSVSVTGGTTVTVTGTYGP